MYAKVLYFRFDNIHFKIEFDVNKDILMSISKNN